MFVLAFVWNPQFQNALLFHCKVIQENINSLIISYYRSLQLRFQRFFHKRQWHVQCSYFVKEKSTLLHWEWIVLNFCNKTSVKTKCFYCVLIIFCFFGSKTQNFQSWTCQMSQTSQQTTNNSNNKTNVRALGLYLKKELKENNSIW